MLANGSTATEFGSTWLAVAAVALAAVGAAVAVALLRSDVRNALFRWNVGRAFQALRRQLVDPRHGQRDWETDDDDECDEGDGPLG
jgi:hypothetical protein